jgi:hypothetical protein
MFNDENKQEQLWTLKIQDLGAFLPETETATEKGMGIRICVLEAPVGEDDYEAVIVLEGRYDEN